MKWRIGEVMVSKIVELEVTGGSRFILPEATYEAVLPIGWLQPDFSDERGRLKMSIHALVVETPSRRILVDTCLGNDKENRRIPSWNKLQTSFLADLAAAGYPREAIDTVLCTHLHVDHVGWNTMLVDGKWVPTFPRARYLMGRVEFDHWRSQHERDDSGELRYLDCRFGVTRQELSVTLVTRHNSFLHGASLARSLLQRFPFVTGVIQRAKEKSASVAGTRPAEASTPAKRSPAATRARRGASSGASGPSSRRPSRAARRMPVSSNSSRSAATQ